MNYYNQKLKNTVVATRLKSIGLLVLVAIFSLSNITIAQNKRNKESVLVIKDGNRDRSKLRISAKIGGLHNFNIEHRGDIEVTDDDRDIKSISRGGYLEITKTTFGSKRSILIEASGGQLIREYREGRRLVDYEPDGRKWLAEILPDIVRSSGIAAESRINRLYKQGGAKAVMDEIGRLDGSYVQAIYAKKLLNKSGLSKSDLILIAKGLPDEIDSDYYLAQALKDNSDKFLNDEKTAQAYFDAVGEIGSDYYAAAVLKTSLEDYTPSAQSITKIMDASRNIGSDYYQAAVLSSVLEVQELEGDVLAEIISSSKDISSDYYQSQILSKAIGSKNLSTESFEKLMEAVSDVSSDYYMANVFTKLLDNDLDDQVQEKMIILVDDKMSSDYYAASVYKKLIENQDIGESSASRLAFALEDMGSANYASTVIKEAAGRRDLSKGVLKILIKAASEINSDYYKASALEALARRVNEKNDADLKEAYRNAAKNINSDTYYGKAMRALDR
ncbi:MAG: hypothetical protein AAFN93_13990 [Bacteroidota bacterium]